MANTRLSMRKIKEVLRLTHDGHLNTRQVALSLNISRSTVKDYQARAQKAGLFWPLPETLSEEALEQKLFPPLVGIEAPAKALPDFDYIYRELKSHKKFNLTLDQLWREYREPDPSWLPILAILPALSRLPIKARLTDAPGPQGRREIVCRLWRRPIVSRSANQRSDHNRALCRGLGRVHLHLRRSHSYPTTARLDRLPYPSLRLLRFASPKSWSPIV